MLQSSHVPPTPLSRPRPPSRRQSSSSSISIVHTRLRNSLPPSGAPLTENPVSDLEPVSDEPDRRAREETPPVMTATAALVASEKDMMKDSPLSAAARLLKHKVPGFTVDDSGVGSLHEAFLGPSEDGPAARSRAGSVASQRSNVSAGGTGTKALSQEWIQAKTRDELEELLLEADRVIRERERDLSIAASIGKSLLENNVALRARQTDASGSQRLAAPRLTPRKPTSKTGRCELIEGLPPPSPLKFNAPSSSSVSDDVSRGHSRRSSVVGSDLSSLPASSSPSASNSVRSSPSSPRIYHRHHRSVPLNPFVVDGVTVSPTKNTWSPGHRSNASISTSASSLAGATPRYRHNSAGRASPLVSKSAGSDVSSKAGKRSGRTGARNLAQSLAAQQTLLKLEQQNSELADQLASLESEAAEGEEQGRKRLSRVVRELEGVRRKLREAETRNGELERENEELVEGQATTKRLLRQEGQGRALRKLEGLEEEDEVDDAEGLGRKAEEIGERMRRVLKKLSEGTIDEEDDEDDVEAAVEAEIAAEAEKRRLELEEQDRRDERSFSDRHPTNVDSGPTTPTLDVVLLDAASASGDADADLTPLDPNPNRSSYLSVGSGNTASDETATKRSSFRSSLSSLLTGPAAAPIQQPSAQESALIAALLMQIAELQNSQMGFDYERAELLGKLGKAQEEVEDLKREIAEMDEEYGFDDDEDGDDCGWDEEGKKVGWQERRGLIGWHGQSVGNQAMIESRRRHRFSAPVGYGRDQPFKAPHQEMSTAPAIKTDDGLPRRSLHSEMGSQWGAGSQHDEGEAWETDGTASDGEADTTSSLRPPRPRRPSPSHRRQRRQAQIAKTYEEIERMAQELPVEWADDDELFDSDGTPSKKRVFRGRRSPQKGNLKWAFEAEADAEDAGTADPWSGEVDKATGIESREAVEERWAAEAAERKRIARLMVEKRRREMEEEGSSEFDGPTIGSSGDSTARGTSSATPTEYTGELRSRRSQALRRLGLDSDEEDWEEEESWDFIDAFDHENRRPGERGTDYYPVSLRARHAPRMVVQRLHDRWMRWFLLVAQWVQLFVVITLAVGWAISKGPKAILEGRKGFDRRGGRSSAKLKRIM